MGGAVVLAGGKTVLLTYLKGHGISHLEHAFYHTSHMADLAALKVDGILHLEFAIAVYNHTGIGLLAAHGAVKWSLLHDNRSALPVSQRLNQIRLRSQNRNLGIMHQSVVAHKCRGDGWVD